MKQIVSCLALAAALSSPAWAHGFQVPAPPAPTLQPRPGLTVTRPVPLLGGTTPRLSPPGRTTARAIRDELAIRWTPQFLAPTNGDGYDRANLSIEESVRRDVKDGGWVRRHAPSIVLSYDPTNPDHLRIVRSIEIHPRLRVAAHLFNCFRVDSRLLPEAERGVRVRTFTTDGQPAGTLAETLSGPKVWRLAEEAFAASTRTSLAQVIPQVETLLGTVVLCENQMQELEHALVCPSCGKGRDDALSSLAQWRQRRDDAKARLDQIVETD